MEFFESTTQVVTQPTILNEEEEDQLSTPFVDENPCLVCGHKAFANFIDLSYNTSCTSTTVTPVKKRLKEILGKIWNQKIENQTLCLACYELVDRYDGLESQLCNIRENLSDKYQMTVNKLNGKSKVVHKKKGRNCKGKKSIKKTKTDFASEGDEDDVTFTVEICHEEEETELLEIEENGKLDNDSMEIQQPLPEVPQFPMELQEPEANLNVYDEHHQLLQRGEKIRLGKSQQDENGVESFLCAYCPQAWADITSLHTHVHNIHQPEVVDVAIPPELGLGNTMNCGVEIQNCQEPPENPKPWSCLFCDASFRARTNMSSHFKEKHTPHKPFLCTDCGDAFRKGIDLNRHKLYFCPRRVVSFAPKRKYKKRDPVKEKSTAQKPVRTTRASTESDEKQDISVQVRSVPVS